MAMKKTTVALVSCALTLSMGLSGCFLFKRGEEKTPEPVADVTVGEVAMRTIGDTTVAAHEVTLVNALDVPIETFALRPVGTLEYGGDLLGGSPIAPGEQVLLRVNQEGASAAYDAMVTSGAGSVVYEFGGLPVQGVTQVFLHTENNVPYLDYIGNDGVVSSTKDYLVAQSAPAVLASYSDEGASTIMAGTYVADDAASQTAVVAQAETVGSSAYGSSDYGYASYDDFASDSDVPLESSASLAQSEDTCIDDVVLK